MKESTRGKILIVGVLAALVVGGTLLRLDIATTHAEASSGLTQQEQGAITALLSDPRIASAHIRDAQPVVVNRVTQGDDTIAVVREDTSDDKGSMTFYFILENGHVVDATFAQNGSAQAG